MIGWYIQCTCTTQQYYETKTKNSFFSLALMLSNISLCIGRYVREQKATNSGHHIQEGSTNPDRAGQLQCKIPLTVSLSIMRFHMLWYNYEVPHGVILWGSHILLYYMVPTYCYIMRFHILWYYEVPYTVILWGSHLMLYYKVPDTVILGPVMFCFST